MYVSPSLFDEVLVKLNRYDYLSIDTETTGLRPYHGDKLFSIIIGTPQNNYYFNWYPYEGEETLTSLHKDCLQATLFNRQECFWFVHNAKYDMAILEQDHLELKGTVLCTATLARLENNEHFSYSLDACAARLGHKKDDKVAQYIADHKLWDEVELAGTQKKIKNKRFYDVPKDIIVPYGERDAEVTFQIGKEMIKSIGVQSKTFSKFQDMIDLESKVTKACFNMERTGIQLDIEFCKRAAYYWKQTWEEAREEYKAYVGTDFTGSWQSLSKVFKSHRDQWVMGKPTKKKGEINPMFGNDVIKNFDHPMSTVVQKIRNAKSKSDFFHGFLYQADENGVIHPNWNQYGTTSGRFSSSEPNFQNLEKARDEASMQQEYIVRRAIVPRPGYIFIMPDYDQVEYRLMLDYAADLVGYETPLATKVLGGLDVHSATQEIVQELIPNFTRRQAKTVNFGILYGLGLNALSDSLGVTRNQAMTIKAAVLGAAPEIGELIRHIETTSQVRGFVHGWSGRKFLCPNKNFAYKMPNRLIQGGSADITKKAMTLIDKYLADKKSNMLMTIHDELVIEVHNSEVGEVPRKVHLIMENAYPHKLIPLTVGMCWSDKSLADKKDGFPDGSEARDSF